MDMSEERDRNSVAELGFHMEIHIWESYHVDIEVPEADEIPQAGAIV